MTRFLWSGAIGALSVLAACAGANTASTGTTTAAQSQQQTQTGAYTDEQVRAYVAAKGEIEPITARYAQMSAQERTQATAQIRAIQQRHGLNAVSYDAIQRRARTDTALAGRIAALELASLSDAQVRAFAEASLEIGPISSELAAATTDAQRADATDRIRAVLASHNLDGATYNAIATRAQTDQELAARVAAAQVAAQSEQAAEANEGSAE